MNQVTLRTGEIVPALGQGTWNLGVTPARRAEEMKTLRDGIELGLSLVDTAEMYGEGATEAFVGEALAGVRERIFLVSKAYPHHASSDGLARACEASLRRLRTDRLDLYLVHWRGTIALEETVEGMEALRAAGKIRHWGVSNFDGEDMADLAAAGGEGCATDQILYNLSRRGAEFALLPRLAEAGVPIMAYSPVEQGRLLGHAALGTVARRLDASAAQVALAWLLRRPGTIVIPKTGDAAHLRENAAARDLVLAPEDVAVLDRAFPPPRREVPLAML